MCKYNNNIIIITTLTHLLKITLFEHTTDYSYTGIIPTIQEFENNFIYELNFYCRQTHQTRTLDVLIKIKQKLFTAYVAKKRNKK